MDNESIPLPVDDDKTTPMPRQTMAEKVFDCAVVPCCECGATVKCGECGDECTVLELSEDLLCTACVNRHLTGIWHEGPVSYAEDR